MRIAELATISLISLLAAATTLGAVIVFGRGARRVRDRRRTRLAAPARRALLALAAGDDDPALLATLANLQPATWRAVEGTAVAMLGKVRGEAYQALVTVFERRGAGVRALRDLQRRDPVRRARAAEVLGNLGRWESIAPLCGLLGDSDPDVRAVAVRALGRIGESTATQPLLGSLIGRRSVPPQLVAHALLRLGAGAQPGLIAACDHFDPRVRATAVEVLGLAGAVTAADRVVRLLTEETVTDVRVRACTALGRMGTRSALAPLIDAAGSTEPVIVRAAAAQAMGELGAPAAATALAALLPDPHHPVAHAAAQALLRLGATGRDTLLTAAGDTPRTAAGDTRPGSAGDTPPTAAGDTPPTAAGDTLRTAAGDTLRTAAGDTRPGSAARHAREALTLAAIEEHRRAPVTPPSVRTPSAMPSAVPATAGG